MTGDGKYGPYSRAIASALDADAVVVIVKGGRGGDGFSCAATPQANIPALCKALRMVIDQMEKDHSISH